MKRVFEAIGPAVIVAAVVLGPGSILTSSKVGASFGLLGVPVIVLSSILMIAMVALSARLGVVYDRSPCGELAFRLGRGVAVAIGLTLFTLVAFFQSSNNIALIGGLEPMLGDGTLPFGIRASILVVVNALVIGSLYLLKDLYRSVEWLMKLLIGLMTVAFLFNFVVVFWDPPESERVISTADLDWFALLGLVGTTFSVGGAFYQAYLVKEKGWGLDDTKKGVTDSIIGITMLGLVTVMILLTSWRVFYGNSSAATLSSVGDVAKQLEPLFGSAAKVIFCAGILAGGFSSFMVNALIGGTVLSDSLGKGAKLNDEWPLHLTTVALLVGMCVAIASVAREGSTVHLITIAQACTVFGMPALAAALIYLGTRKELTGSRRVPRWMLGLAILGFLLSCVLACLTADRVYHKLNPPPVVSCRHYRYLLRSMCGLRKIPGAADTRNRCCKKRLQNERRMPERIMPKLIEDESQLDAMLASPNDALVDFMRALDGDLLILGIAGKMGVSLGQLAVAAIEKAGVRRRVYGVARFSDPAKRRQLDAVGVETIICDLLDRKSVSELPQVRNVVFMAGRSLARPAQNH